MNLIKPKNRCYHQRVAMVIKTKVRAKKLNRIKIRNKILKMNSSLSNNHQSLLKQFKQIKPLNSNLKLIKTINKNWIKIKVQKKLNKKLRVNKISKFNKISLKISLNRWFNPLHLYGKPKLTLLWKIGMVYYPMEISCPKHRSKTLLTMAKMELS